MAPDPARGDSRSASSAAALEARGVTLFEGGRLVEALVALGEAARLQPGRAQVHYNLGNALVAAGRGVEARNAFRRAADLAPELAPAHGNLGLVLLELGDVPAAVVALRRAVALDPDAPARLSALAVALTRAGDLEAALEAVERNLARFPARTRDLALLAVLLERLARPGRGLLDLEQLVSLCTPPPPAGFPDVPTFNATLAEHLMRRTDLARDPGRHATRGGRHSSDLLPGGGPLAAALRSFIGAAVERYAEGLQQVDAPAALRDLPQDVTLTAWAVVLERGGYQIPHVHPAGWVSGVYYVRAPDPGPDRPHAGALELGTPDPVFAGNHAFPTLRVTPQPGLLVLFPSWLYHGTVPFDTPGPRISIAFDAMRDDVPA